MIVISHLRLETISDQNILVRQIPMNNAGFLRVQIVHAEDDVETHL